MPGDATLVLATALAAVAAVCSVLALVASTRSKVELRGMADATDLHRDRLAELASALVGKVDRGNEAQRLELDRVTERMGSLAEQVERLRRDNDEALERMRATVDEKLSKTLDDRMSASFRQVSGQLEQVYRGLGEMRGLAAGVGDLKRVLGNVKTRGILGEVQLKAILTEVLAPEQYAENVATVPGSAERVEFAVRLPGEGDRPVWLPIDSKLPGDTYLHLRDAADSGDADAVATAWRTLEATIRSEARDIRDKYVCPPETCAFGVMFLPFEGLYAEVVNRAGLLESLQRDYRVVVAGPSTMAALLNSLQMGFQTVAIQRRAGEVQRVLNAVRAELPRYQAALERAQRQILTVNRSLDELVGTRTRAMARRLDGLVALGQPADDAGEPGAPGMRGEGAATSARAAHFATVPPDDGAE